MADDFDVLVRGAEIHDGLGNAPLQGDVALVRDRIAAIGSFDTRRAELEIDASGLAVAPGFIDVHTHDDFAAINHPDMSFKTRGGVTTCVVGNCGFGPAPFAEANEMFAALTPGRPVQAYAGHAGYAAHLVANPPGVNIGVLAGHGTLRLAAMGHDQRAPSGAEMRHMKDMLGEALQAGVLGLSSGLIYDPGRYAERDELIELAGEMRATGALYATHMRDEGAGLLAAVNEAIEIGRAAGVPVQISHHKVAGRENWGLVRASLELIEAAQRRGENVHADQYPYTAGSTSLKAILENGAFSPNGAPGGIGSLAAESVIVASAPGHGDWEGHDIAHLGETFGLSARATGDRIVQAAPGTTVVIHMMSEDDVQTVMRHPSTLIGSDGIPTLDGKPHPRLYNTFARVIGHYARDLGVFDLPTAISRMTGLAARKFSLADRGRIVEGAFADLVVFNPRTIVDCGTFEHPNRYPLGISDVFVNGQAAIRAGKVTGQRAGRVLRRDD